MKDNNLKKWTPEIKTRTAGNGCPKCRLKNINKDKCQKVINLDTNIIYDSITEAQKKTGIERHI